MRWAVLALMATTLGSSCAQQADSRGIILGTQNAESGLRVPNEGDGTNEPATVAGRTGRRATADHPYMYVDVDDAWLPPGDHDLWVTVEFCPESLSVIGLQYEAAGTEDTIPRRYRACEDTALGYRVGEWMHYTFHLPHARLGSGQNYHADFRLTLPGDVVIGRITVSLTQPADYEQTRAPRAEEIGPYRTRIGEGYELTFGNDATPATAALYRMLGVTSIESYVHWQSVEPEARGQWDWSKWDPQAQVLRDSGLKWVPFLIAGCAYATPDWFRLSERSHVYRCLEHGQDSYVQSLWNPNLLPEVDRYLEAFAKHYEPALIESVLLGITGIYGESIYPAGPEGGWTAERTGTYHNHMGFWCGGDLAKAEFRRYLKDRYAVIGALNDRWGSHYASFDEVEPFLPKDSPSDRAYLDFRNWYTGAMTDWSEAWVKAARTHFPDTEIYLCTGGDGNVMLGADFSAQTKRIAPHKAGVRITNEGSDYAANFAITRWVASAGKLYGTYYGYEPASGVDANGVVARIYNATASGCRQLHYYSNNVTGSKQAIDNFRTNARFLRPRKPQVDVAVLLPTEWLALHQGEFGTFFHRVAQIRDVADVDYADSNMIADGCLKRAHFLLAPIGRQFERATLERIEEWVRDGGVLIATGDSKLATIEGEADAQERLFATPDEGVLTGSARPVIVEGQPGASFCLKVGAPWDTPYLGGKWNGPEKGAEWPDEGATKRWSGPRAIAYLPVKAPGAGKLSVNAIVPEHAVGPNPVRVNGVQVGALSTAGKQVWEFSVPAEAMARAPVATVELNCKGWVPADYGGSTDRRTLGLAVRSIALTAEGAQPATEETPPTVNIGARFEGDKVLPQCARTVGKGATLYLPGLWDEDSQTLLAAMAAAMQHPELYAKGRPSLIALDGVADSVYWTLCEDSALVLNFTDAEVTREFAIRESDLRPKAARVGKPYRVTIPARSIAEVLW
jgi:hypothetical protein